MRNADVRCGKEALSEITRDIPVTPPAEAFTAQYYELTLRLRFQRGKWRASVLGPHGLMIKSEAEHTSQPEAAQEAIRLAAKNLHEEKKDARPPLETVDWSSI
jgi:hypothetical protein